MAAALGWPAAGEAIGVDGAAAARLRMVGGAGAGVDQVGGYGQDRHLFVEPFVQAEARVWRRLYVGSAVSYRQDGASYDFALEQWRGGGSGALAAHLLVGYDGDGFHLSTGPWLYGAGRDRPRFRAAVLPWGMVRLRVGAQEGWHGSLRIGDGAPFTAGGGAYAVRVLVGSPARGRHRWQVGPYTTLGETTVGVSVSDDISGGFGGRTVRVGGLVGTDMDAPGRVELTGFVGLVW